jgi:hypothetical protein
VNAPATPIDERLTLWFPLVPRPRPPAGPLPQRITKIGDLARAASNCTGTEAVSTAAQALNMAALIASDCGAEQLAIQLCWSQYELFANAAPLDAKTAEIAVQPLVNLGRILIRARESDRAHQVFLQAFAAVRTGRPTAIEGRVLDVAALSGGEDSLRHLQRFLWKVLLAEGTRALTTAGRWNEALQTLLRHKGVGSRMIDGRQVAILERRAAADIDGALALLDSSNLVDPWERAVAATLHTECLRHGERPYRLCAAKAIDHFVKLPLSSDLAVFQTRLGLTILDLAMTAGLDVARLTLEILHRASKVVDANVARELLGDEVCRRYLTSAEVQVLNELLETSGTTRQGISEATIKKLTSYVNIARDALAAILASR